MLGGQRRTENKQGKLGDLPTQGISLAKKMKREFCSSSLFFLQKETNHSVLIILHHIGEFMKSKGINY